MNLEIMEKEQAANHVPQVRTYGIRINSGNNLQLYDDDYARLEEHPLYVPHVYGFDDCEPGMNNKWEISLAKETAAQMLRDFVEQENSCSTLLIHCFMGQSRSPAVAMAFNHIFELGHSSNELAKRYPLFNIHVARTLDVAAQELNLGIYRKS